MSDVFISYKRDERAVVERLADALRELKLSVWFDARLTAGEGFSKEIDNEVRSAKSVLVCWSPAARESDWVRSEALIGFERRVLAAAYVAGPDGFSAPAPFNGLHAEDLRAWFAAPSQTHSGWRSLIRRLGKLSGRDDLESWGALDAQASAAELQAWVTTHPNSPLLMAVDSEIETRAVGEREREALEARTRERHAAEHNARARLERVERERRDSELRIAESTHAAASILSPLLRGILILTLLATIGAYFTNPKAEAYFEPARAAVRDVGEAQLNSGDVIGAISSGVLGTSGEGEYTSYYVASSYSLPNAQNPTVTCYGAFTKVLTCQHAAAAAPAGG